MSKLKTPEWILQGKEKPKKKKAEKIFKIKRCPECNSEDVGVVVGEEKKGEWQCRKCKWKGNNIKEIEINEKDFMKYSSKMED